MKKERLWSTEQTLMAMGTRCAHQATPIYSHKLADKRRPLSRYSSLADGCGLCVQYSTDIKTDMRYRNQ
jgi:hypothetical protein